MAKQFPPKHLVEHTKFRYKATIARNSRHKAST